MNSQPKKKKKNHAKNVIKVLKIAHYKKKEAKVVFYLRVHTLSTLLTSL